MEVLGGLLSEKWQWVLDSSPYLHIFPNCYFFCASNAQMEWWPSTWVNNIFQHKADLPKRDRGSGSWNTMLLVPRYCWFRVCACVQCFNLPTTLVKRWSHGLFANRKDREISMLIMEPFIFAHPYSFAFHRRFLLCNVFSLAASILCWLKINSDAGFHPSGFFPFDWF